MSVPPCAWGFMSWNPDRTSDEKISKVNSPSLATNDNLCPVTAAEVVENLLEDNEKGWISKPHRKNRIDDTVLGIIVPIGS